jgi:hypothetical protein
VLEDLLGKQADGRRPIARLRRAPFAFSSSYAIEELEVVLENGNRLELVFKNLSQRALLMEARSNKPLFLLEPAREIEVYRTVLPRCSEGTASYIGSFIDEHSEDYWLFLEKVPGVELNQVGDFSAWLGAARWLAKFHDAASNMVESAQPLPLLLQHDEAYFRAWPRRAISNLEKRQANGLEELRRLVDRYERVIEGLLALPRTLLHGDFNASNILVRQHWKETGSVEADHSALICPVDWEMAAVGPGLTDLAALISGSWDEAQRTALVDAYLDARRHHRVGSKDPVEVMQDVKFCQLHLAIQWLGWSPGWTPPAEHRQNWLGQAEKIAHELGL